jgi:hypothetical protein
MGYLSEVRRALSRAYKGREGRGFIVKRETRRKKKTRVS